MRRVVLLAGLILLRASLPPDVDVVKIAAHLVAVAKIEGKCKDAAITLDRMDTLNENNEVERTVVLVSCAPDQREAR